MSADDQSRSPVLPGGTSEPELPGLAVCQPAPPVTRCGTGDGGSPGGIELGDPVALQQAGTAAAEVAESLRRAVRGLTPTSDTAVEGMGGFRSAAAVGKLRDDWDGAVSRTITRAEGLKPGFVQVTRAIATAEDDNQAAVGQLRRDVQA